MKALFFWSTILLTSTAFARGGSYSREWNIGSIVLVAVIAIIAFKALHFIGKLVLNSEIHRKEDLYIIGFVVVAAVMMTGKYLINLIL